MLAAPAMVGRRASGWVRDCRHALGRSW